jgi:outer membrane protein OmpA-like peptidoglycan-associated protein
MKKLLLVTVIYFAYFASAQCQDVNTSKYTLFFPLSSITLSKAMEDSIAEMFRDLNTSKIIYVDISCYSNEENNRIFNSALATRRAKAIADFVKTANLAPVNVVNYNGYPENPIKETTSEINITYFTERPIPEIPKNTTGIDKAELLAGKNIRLKINFFPGEANLLPSASPYLAQLKQFLEENPEINIEIQGHVCCNNNVDLSLDRAEEIYIKLQEMGIKKERLQYKGYGNTMPSVPDTSDENREMNRRVEIKLLQ